MVVPSQTTQCAASYVNAANVDNLTLKLSKFKVLIF